MKCHRCGKEIPDGMKSCNCSQSNIDERVYVADIVKNNISGLGAVGATLNRMGRQIII